LEVEVVPILEVETKSAEQIWQSPDGQRVINKLTLDYQGKEFYAKTFSRDIAKVGWKGKVETYEKVGTKGSETFVKQPPKEDGNYGGNKGSNKDEDAIQAMWAITKAIEWAGIDKDVKFTDIPSTAIIFFNMVDEVKKGKETVIEPEDEPHVEPLPETQSLDEFLGIEKDE